MKLTKYTIGAPFAAVLIGGLAFSPASAAVRNEISHFDINEYVLNLELKGDVEPKNDTPYNTDHLGPNGKAQAVFKSRSEGKTNDRS